MRVLFQSLVLSTLVVTAGCGGSAEAEPATQGPTASPPATESATAMLVLQADTLIVKAEVVHLQSAQPVVEESAPRQRTASAPASPVRYASTSYRPAANPAPARQPRVVTENNIRRDAAIGAGVGAVAGAIIHDRNRWKGAVVGGVIGGAAGAVVGATIDKNTRVVY